MVLGTAFVTVVVALGMYASSAGWADVFGGTVLLLLFVALAVVFRYRADLWHRQQREIRNQERVALARELHDTVAHHVSAIAVQAQAGRVVAGVQPEKAAAVPLQIHFTKQYRYRLRGTDRVNGRDAWVVDFASRLFDRDPDGQDPLAQPAVALIDKGRARLIRRRERVEDIPDLKLPKEMLDLATHIVNTKTGHFDPSQFEDRYENALIDLLKKKQAGEKIEPAREMPAPRVVNLMEALRASIDAEKKKASAPSVPRARKPAKKKASQ